MGTILRSSEHEIRTGPLKALFGQFEGGETDINSPALSDQLLQLQGIACHEPSLDGEIQHVIISSIESLERCLATVRPKKTLAAPLELRAAFLWPLLLPEGFIDLARHNHPWALAMLAHYSVLLYWIEDKCWFIRAFARSLVHAIAALLTSSSWAHLIEWPLQIIHRRDCAY